MGLCRIRSYVNVRCKRARKIALSTRLSRICKTPPLTLSTVNETKTKSTILFTFFIFFSLHTTHPWKVRKIRLFGTFLLSFLHFPKYFLYFSQSKTMNRMGGSLHQKRRFFADLPCTLLSTYTYPKIFNTPYNTPSKIPQKHSNNTPKIHTTLTQHPPKYSHNPHTTHYNAF